MSILFFRAVIFFIPHALSQSLTARNRAAIKISVTTSGDLFLSNLLIGQPVIFGWPASHDEIFQIFETIKKTKNSLYKGDSGGPNVFSGQIYFPEIL